MRYAILLLIAALGYPLLASSSSTAASLIDDLPSVPRGAFAPRIEHRGAPAKADVLHDESAQRSPPGQPGLQQTPRLDHGAVPDGTTVFNGQIPGVANLDPSLLAALRRAATDAADDGVEFFVNSGWRSPEYQEQLLHAAVSKYGSEREAARWVATPNTSAHVSGDAVDIGFAATAWLSKYGAEYGLCQVYRNEPWHYELRREAIDHGCPPMYADPAHDPRMRQ